jgi:hypothetical protein
VQNQLETRLDRALVLARGAVEDKDDTLIGRAMDFARIDFFPSDRQPSLLRVAIATLISIVGSLAADALIVKLAVAAVPADKGYVHFLFSDYAKLTVIGVLIACAAWPIVTRATSSPRLAFFRMAIAVTIVLFLPDLYLLAQHQPFHAVFFLMLMHLAIALVTYNLLVRLAPCDEQWT